ncbi:MAG: Vitamin B12 dependent methionine synthase activation subunit [Clostridium sp.]|nr:Vitamin B12 dependent methionine synthase activation subunit [Clostridium sp.]
MDVNRREIYRYLGIKANEKPDAATEKLAEECIAELSEKCRPRSFARWFPCAVTEAAAPGSVERPRVTEAAAPIIDFSCFQVKSRDLAKNLRGCGQVILFAATIGEGADFLTRKYSRTNVAKAVVMQAAAAAMVEAFCDEENKKLREQAEEQGWFLRPRFSPGYGDFSLEHQRDFARVLEMQKTVGITLSESLLMLPSKSVTAVIGAGRTDTKCVLSGCESCGNADCAFRRS